ncbi:MAG: sigma-70 family RNA polymerase sigma factor [Wenzhouxiangellaceae bacterium]
MIRETDTGLDIDRLAVDHGRDVFAAAFRVTGNGAVAEDIQQNVFVRLIERPPKARIESWKSYLCAMATRAAIDELRRGQRWKRLTGPLLAARSSPDAQPTTALDNRIRARTLRVALGRIPRRQAECFALRFFDGLELAEIADAMSTTSNAVSVTLNRAVRALQHRISVIETRSPEAES